MRIALVHKSLADTAMGGVARVYRGLAAAYQQLGHEVVTLSPFPCSWSPRHVLAPAHESPDLYAAAVDELLSQLDVDVAECSSWESELGVYALRPRAERALVAVRCEMSSTDIGGGHLAGAEYRLLAAADVRLAVSRSAAASIHRAYPRVHVDAVVGNGVDRGWLGSEGVALEAVCDRHLAPVDPLAPASPSRLIW